MKVVIVEDEIAASDNLTYILKSINSEIEVLNVIDSVADAIDYFSNPTEAVLVFMDIHLADGISFEIFEKVKIEIPIIFTTAYDQYAIQAFKVNSLDYLLKPVSEEDMEGALQKYEKASANSVAIEDQLKGVMSLLQASTNNNYKLSYLIQKRDELIPIKVADIAYFFIDMGIVKAVTFEKQEYTLNKKLETIEEELDPTNFTRVNRQYILNKQSIDKLKFHFNGKLIVDVHPKTEERIIVSKLKASEIKAWLNS
ncbi:LytTR family DNA-binding domain-containing protein [Flavicella sp.]|uniref:LytR/AlgR family response regulator transcription factor n=1 Tax=Flavicella sp. TaxID=2957742 RepID=UPI0026237B5D|nr:LytTR family DNA-binding domain-containing protein [Flavicella sp.]MDG1804956.1 LytTR family DNA-binding domain-containing protein [Flavicella sp.]